MPVWCLDSVLVCWHCTPMCLQAAADSQAAGRDGTHSWSEHEGCVFWLPAGHPHWAAPTCLNTFRKAARLYSYMLFTALRPAMTKNSTAPRVATEL